MWRVALGFLAGLLLARTSSDTRLPTGTHSLDEGCPVSGSVLSHVVIPLASKQWGKLEETIGLWWTRHRPCALLLRSEGQAASPRRPHLVLLVGNSASAASTERGEEEAITAAAIEALLPTATKLRECFASVRICRVHMAPALDTHVEGARALFEAMLLGDSAPGMQTKDCFGGGTGQGRSRRFALVMEPDTRPIRNDWLAEVQRYLSTNVPASAWIVGPMFHGQAQWVPPSDYAYFRYHLNGNALFNLDTTSVPNLVSFYTQRIKPFAAFLTKTKPGSGISAHDTLLFEYLAQPEAWDFLRLEAAHRILATDVILNLWRTPWTLSDVLARWPNALLVHGGVPSVFEQRGEVVEG